MTTTERPVALADLPTTRTTGLHPGPGRGIMACRCGRMLHAGGMHRLVQVLPGGTPIAAIVCGGCAA